MEEKENKVVTGTGSTNVQIISGLLALGAVIAGLAQTNTRNTIVLVYWFGLAAAIAGIGFLIAYALRLLEDILATLHAHAQDYQSINFRRREQ